ncbi:MAG: hypothetical protein ACYCXF_09290 [Thermoleophilia bacterium]
MRSCLTALWNPPPGQGRPRRTRPPWTCPISIAIARDAAKWHGEGDDADQIRDKVIKKYVADGISTDIGHS